MNNKKSCPKAIGTSVAGRVNNRSGMTLIEVMVALLIIAAVAVIAVFGFLTLGRLDVRNTDRVRADQNLSGIIAMESTTGSGFTKSSLPQNAIVLGGISIPIKSDRYTWVESGDRYTVFDYA